MKKFIFLFVLILLTCTCTSCAATPKERFDADKSRIKVVSTSQELNKTFREALESSNDFKEVIVDSYVTTGFYAGECYCKFAVLTKDGEYLQYQVEDPEVIFQLCEDSDVKEIGAYRLEGDTLRHQ